MKDPGALYRQASESFQTLIRSLADDDLTTEVPACPGWTVHGVVSHLAGVATDAVNGELQVMPGPERTAVQVEARAATPTALVLREWERAASQVEMLLAKSGASALLAAIDITVHEHDVRGAVGLPGNRGGAVIDVAVGRAVGLLASKVESSGLVAVKVVDPTIGVVAGPEETPVAYMGSVFEFFRAAYGRRSRAQIERRLATDDPAPYVELISLLGPASDDIIE